MKIIKRIIIGAIAALVAFSFTACASGSAPGSSEAPTASETPTVSEAPAASVAPTASAVSEVPEASETPKYDYVMKLGSSGALCAASLHIAMINGYFEDEGINYELVNFTGTADIPTLLATGQLDANQFMLAQLSVLMNSGLDVRAAVGLHKGCLVIAAPVDSDINSVEDLEGRRIGVPGIGSTPMVITQRALARAGIDSSMEAGKVEFLSFSAGDLGVAMENGSVDAIAIVEPSGSLLVEKGDAKIIFDLGTDEGYKDEYCCVAALNTKFAEEHPGMAAGYVRALQKACQFIENNPEEAARLQIENNMCNLGNLEINTRLLDSYNFKGSVSGGRDAFRANLVDLQTLGLLDMQYNVDDIINRVYIEFPDVENEID